MASTESAESAEKGQEVHEWYVRLENMYLNDSCVGYKRIITIGYSYSSLVKAILSYYRLPETLKDHMRIWTTPFRMQRLDQMKVIPEGEMFLSVEFR